MCFSGASDARPFLPEEKSPALSGNRQEVPKRIKRRTVWIKLTHDEYSKERCT